MHTEIERLIAEGVTCVKIDTPQKIEGLNLPECDRWEIGFDRSNLDHLLAQNPDGEWGFCRLGRIGLIPDEILTGKVINAVAPKEVWILDTWSV